MDWKNRDMLAMAAVSQIAISGWESLEADLKMAVADVILSNLPTSFILEMTASICGKIGKGNVVKYDFLKVCEGSFSLKDHEVVDLGSGLGSVLASKRLKMDLKIEDHFECGFLRKNENFETKLEAKTGSKRDLKSGLKLQSKHDTAFDAKFDIIPGLSMEKIPGLLSEIYHNQTPSPTNTTLKCPSAVQKKINSKKVVVPDNNLPRSASSSFLSLINLEDLDNKLPSMFSDKPGSEEQFQLKRNAPMPDHFMQKSQTALRRMRILKCVKPSCPEQYVTQSCEDLWEHLTTKHEDEFLCPNCSRLLKERAGLENHFQSCYRKFTCEICGTDFTRKDNLLRHKKSRHQGEHFFLPDFERMQKEFSD